jgi:C4-type Zn-finger protein
MKNIRGKIEKYIRAGGDRCPVCKSGNLKTTNIVRNISSDNPECILTILCRTCQLEYEETYVLKSVKIRGINIKT